MRIYSLLLFILFAQATTAQEDASKEVYFEKTEQGLVRFYFDNNYFLVDKNCAFKSIERISEFIVSKNVFNGAFKDFDQNGRVILTGYYDAGIKQGLFKAYHANGALKWEMNFKDNFPQGIASYFYPDGKPMLVVNYKADALQIISFWDQKARPRVVEGNGTYAFKMPIIFYSEYGYPFFERKGKLKNGYPVGYWTTNFIDDKNRAVLYTEEQYSNNGMLVDGYNLFLDESYNSPAPIIPTEGFPIAETLTFKQCNFDDFSGFNNYLAETLEASFSGVAEKPTQTQHFSYSVALSKEGVPSKAVLIDKLENEKLNEFLATVLRDIPFYFPSLNNEGEPISDTLTISGKITLDSTGNYDFHSILIKRVKQP